jgi:hypothetical protein
MGLRLAVARQQGFDETEAEKIDHYSDSDLTVRQQLALRLTDTFVTYPSVDAGLRDELRAQFTPAELVELVLDASKWSTQKISVSLGLDAPVLPGGLVELLFDGDGRALFGAALEPEEAAGS